MTASTSFATLHQWLLADPATVACARTIVLHVDGSVDGKHLIEGIADYLNEYDDDGDGRWLPATAGLVAKVCADLNCRRLLGIPDTVDDRMKEPLMALVALARRGHVILQAPANGLNGLPGSRAFHAGVCRASHTFADCHLILNPELIDPTCITRIIGDVFLEWLHCRLLPGAGLHQME